MYLIKKVESFVTDCKSKSEKQKNLFANDFKTLLEKEYKDLSTDAQVKMINTLGDIIIKLLKSNETVERKTGLIFLNNFIDIELNDYGMRSKCIKEVTTFIPTNETDLLELNAAVFVKYVQNSLITSDTFDHEMKKSKKYLTDEPSERKLYTLILFRECSKSLPSMSFPYLIDHFHAICACLTDPKNSIRDITISLIRDCFAIFVPRENRDNSIQRCYEILFKTFSVCIKLDASRPLSDDIVIASLSALRELLRISSYNVEFFVKNLIASFTDKVNIDSDEVRFEAPYPRLTSLFLMQRQNVAEESTIPIQTLRSSACLSLIEKNYIEILDYLARLLVSKSNFIAQNSTYIMSILSGYKKELFIMNYSALLINHILTNLNVIKDRNLLFLSIAVLTNELKEKSSIYINKVLEFIHALVTNKEFIAKPKQPILEPLILACMTVLVKYCKKEELGIFIAVFSQILENTALTPAVVNSITICHRLLPNWQSLINNLVNIIIYRCLKYKPHKVIIDTSISIDTTPEEDDTQQLVLVLRTIRTLGIYDQCLLSSLYNASKEYIGHSNKIVRFEAAKTCLKIMSLVSDNIENTSFCSSKQQQTLKISSTIKKLLTIGVTDTDEDIRLCILCSMFDCHNDHLSRLDLIKVLTLGLRDESIKVREAVIRLLGSLSSSNPEFVSPILDKCLVECLTELKFATSGNNEFSARILSSLISSSSRIAFSCMIPILNFLLPKISDSNFSDEFITTILIIITDLSYFCGTKMLDFIPDIISHNLKLLSMPGSCSKKEQSIICIILTLRHTGFIFSDDKYLQIYEILLSLIKTEYTRSTLRLVIQGLGCIGVRDPYRFRVSMNSGMIDVDRRKSIERRKIYDENLFQNNFFDQLYHYSSQSDLDEFYAGIIINMLLKILMDESLSCYHSLVVQAIQNICVALGNKCFQYLSQIFPTYIDLVRSIDPDMKKILLEQIAKLISMAKSKTSPYLDDLFTLINEIWIESATVSLQASIIKVIEYLVISIPDEAGHWMPHIIPKMTNIILSDRREFYVESDDNQLTTLLLSAIQRMAPYLKDHLYLIMPALIKGFDGSNKPIPLQVLAITTIQTLFLSNDLSDYVSPIVLSMIRAFEKKPHLHNQCISLLCVMCENSPLYVKNFVSLISQAIIKNRINCPELEGHICMIKNYVDSTQIHDHSNKKQSIGNMLQQKRDELMDSALNSNSTNVNNLMRVWQTSQRVSKEDWSDWLNRLTHEMIKESPSGIIRFCSAISQSYGNFSRGLFPYSFFSSWKEFKYKVREDLVKCLNQALEVPDMNEIVIVILNLIEFMEHTESDKLPFKPEQLANYSFQASAFIKSLRYTEECLRSSEDIDVLQSLISLNTLLNNRDAAGGVLSYALKVNVNLRLQPNWYEKLHDWDNALAAYNTKIENNPRNRTDLLGKMRCLEALCEWTELDKLVTDNWCDADHQQRIELARMGSVSSIGVAKYKKLKLFTDFLPKQTFDGSFYRAVYSVHTGEYEIAQRFLDNARDLLENELSTVLNESYERGYRTLFTCQILTELDEMINFKLFPIHKATIKDEWTKRIRNCQRVVSDWQKILDLRSIVLAPHDNIESWLKFASVCRKLGRFSLCNNTFRKLLTSEDIELFNKNILPNVDPCLAISYIKFMYATQKQTEAFSLLKDLSNKLLSRIYIDISTRFNQNICLEHIISKSHLQLGLWSMNETSEKIRFERASEYLQAATNYDKNSHKAWHAWAKLNYEIVLNYKHNKIIPNSGSHQEEDNTVFKTEQQNESQIIVSYALPAVKAFFKSLQLSEKNSFQDALRLLTLWFEYGENQEMYITIERSIKTVKIETWIQVIPQLIARIDTPKIRVRKNIQSLLIMIGNSHPQSFIYPLMLSSKSNNQIRKLAANEILKSVSGNFPGLVEQATMISNELIRVSILWPEELCDIIEKASIHFFTERNIEATLALLDSIHAKILAGPETPAEISFWQNYGRELTIANRYRESYDTSLDIRDLFQAWSYYYNVFRRLSKQISKIESIDLHHSSPKLLKCSNLILAIPGTYQPHTETICIQSVQPTLKVIGSQQKPRKLTMKGTDGKNYDFLLKGHEDLRQDERVMQLFGLLNNVLINNQETFKRQLEITRYSVTPLSTDSGLIGWVPECDTINSLIKDYRTKKNINFMVENKIMTKFCRKFDTLDLLHKVELFELVLESTADDDLANSLWQKSRSAEIWFNKRKNFTRSLAVMSMVGYILGLGDRHPSNIMQECNSGQIIHIDFGDCFEVAMKREKFPEKIPFRLTRMLRRCMEVTGIEGTYKVTCIKVMEVLRENKDSLLAVLEAFIYDPLLNWRLLDSKEVAELAPQTSVIDSDIGEGSLSEIENDAKFNINSYHSACKSDKDIQPEVLNKRAVTVINRVKDKLNGTDFETESIVDVNAQVDLLIQEATSIENLAQSYIGWCPFW